MDKIKVPRYKETEEIKPKESRSHIMKRITSKNTKCEIIFRKALWKLGLRYRICAPNIYGKPDIVFMKQKIAIFIDGEFWHGYNWETKKERLTVNKKYWIPKIERNIQRDKEVNEKLTSESWLVLRFWERDVKKDLQSCLNKVIISLSNAPAKNPSENN